MADQSEKRVVSNYSSVIREEWGGAVAENGSARRARRATATSNFGVGRRESHDASKFYARFDAPILSTDEEVRSCSVVDRLFCADSRDMGQVEDKSISLVTTSPPYYSSKAYEEAMGEGHIPGSYVEYLEMLHAVFTECRRVLEPGGRICVNVANLGRKPSDLWPRTSGRSSRTLASCPGAR
jgi:DNA modification methylase